MKNIIMVGVILGAVISCGSDDVNDAPVKCDAFVDRVCTRGIECKDATDTTTFSECTAATKTELPCAQADGISDGYTNCMSELATIPCTVFWDGSEFRLPATCNGSILFKQ